MGEVKGTVRTLRYRDFARNIKSTLEGLQPGEIIEVRGEKKGVVCFLTKELETFTSRRQHRDKQNPNSWL